MLFYTYEQKTSKSYLVMPVAENDYDRPQIAYDQHGLDHHLGPSFRNNRIHRYRERVLYLIRVVHVQSLPSGSETI